MSVTEEDLAVDRELAEVSGLLPLLRYTTPVNTTEQYERFIDNPIEPGFEYLPLPDLLEIARRLQQVDTERTNDPMIGHLARIKKRELELIIELLTARGTPKFLMTSVELFGHVDSSLVDLAATMLARPISKRDLDRYVGPQDLAEAAEVEIARYRLVHPELMARVRVEDTTTGVRVENGDLYIGPDVRVPVTRVDALLQHEVGVHVLTYANGVAQPLQLLAAGLPGYEENQEALGVLAEYLSGGLTQSRMRVLALRVVASHLRSDGSTFVETFQRLRGLGAGKRVAFTTTMRSHRSGGMTRDAGYLRGFVRLLEHIAAGGHLRHLLMGKVRLEDEPLIDDLIARQVLSEPALTPRFLDRPGGQSLLAGLRQGVDVLEIGVK